MKLKIEVELDNAAFDEEEELPRILVDLASRVPDPPALTGQDLSIHDSNGNWVGYARIAAGKVKGR